MDYLSLVAAGYLLGSLPFGVIAGRVFGGVDVRDYGSGSAGSTNVLRTVGVKIAVPVLFLDMGKTVLAVVIARLFSDSPGVEAAAALAAVVGHNWPVFIGFKGGKGIAPGWGGLLILSPVSGLVAGAVGLPVVAIWRYVSLGSILGTGVGAVTLIALSLADIVPLAFAWYGIIAAPLVVFQHRENIQRLIRSEERKLGEPAGETKSQGKTDGGKGIRWPKSV